MSARLTLGRQSKLLAWLAALALATVMASALLTMREVRDQSRESEMAELTVQDVHQLRYLVMETALQGAPRVAAQWHARMAGLGLALAAHQYSSARENALLARERANLATLAGLYARMADAPLGREAGAALPPTVASLFQTSQQMIDDATELLRQNRLAVRAAQQRARRVVGAGVLLLAALIVACIVILRRRVLVPVAALQAVMERVAGGDLGARVHLREHDEIGQLGASFDRMTAELEAALARMGAENAERRRAQAALEQTVAQLAERSGELARAQGDLQSIIDHTPALVAYWDRDMRNRFANRAYQDWYGIAPADMRGMHMREVIGAARYGAIEDALEAVMRGHGGMFERTMPHDGGGTRHLLLSYVPDVQDGQVQGVYGFVSDISQLKLAQAGQAQALARLHATVDAAIDFSIIATAADGTIELFSKGAERLLGYRADEVVGRATPALFHRPDEVAALARTLAAQGRSAHGFAALVEGTAAGQSQTREWTYVRRDGAEIEVSVTVTALRDGAGAATGYLGVAKDIGRDKALLRTLAAARDEAEAGSRAKSQFLANVSHEIRTPMNAVLGLLQLLCQSDLDPVQRGHAEHTQVAARSLLRLLNGILDFSKADAGKMTLECAPFGLAGLAAELAGLARPLVGAKPVALRFTLDPALPRQVLGDALRLRQVLLNLIDNAIKFTARGEVALEIAPRGSLIEFSVLDSGIGIDAHQLDAIFEPFSQAEASTARRFGGTGLGLAISQRLVRLMGAALEASSVPGAGSRFWFALALAPVPALDGHAALALPRQPRLAGLRVMVVDDNELNRQVAEALLGSEGAEVTMADGGVQALQLLRERPDRVELVLMDVQMPDMDGHAATRAIRAEPLLRRLPVLAMTANAMAGDREACLAAGMNDYVEKPIDLDVLVEALLRHRGRRAAGAHGDGAARALARMGGDRALFLNVADKYPIEARALAGELDACLAHGQAPQAARLCHGLRGVAGAVGRTRWWRTWPRSRPA